MPTTPPLHFALHSDEKVSHGFFRILGEIALCARQLPTSTAPISEKIHDGRLLIKRLRALLWFARPVLTESAQARAKTALHKAAHLLAAQRDTNVTRATLEILARKSRRPGERTALHKTLIHLEQKKKPAPDEKKSIERAMKELCLLIDSTKRGIPKNEKWPSGAKRVKKATLTEHKAGKKARHTATDLDYHAWRKKAKRLLYLLELRKDVATKDSRRALKDADKLQEKLGQHQDCVVVEDRLKKVKALPAVAIRTAQLLKARKNKLKKKSRKIALRLEKEL